MNTREFGKLGEDSAAEYLEAHGYHILGKNVFVGRREIDIIAENETHLAFVEVKTRRQVPDANSIFGPPADAVDYKKRENLVSAAEEYLLKNGCDKSPRIDVIEVYISPFTEEYKVLDVRHYENAVKKTGKFSRKKYRTNLLD